jgi:cation diffusion facilitator family transporter
MRSPFRHVPLIEARAAAAALGAGVALMGVKFVAYFLTGSAVIFADALESIVNVAAASFALYSLVLAHRPADADHPYGHGKVEFLSAGFEGGMILLASVLSAANAVAALLRGRHLGRPQIDWGMALMAGTLVVNGALGAYLVRTGRRQRSLTLIADGRHLLSDAVTSVVALAALVAVRTTGRGWLDPAAALVVSFYIAWVGVKLFGQAVGGLMDRQDFEDEALLRRILDAHLGPGGSEPRACGYHKLRHRHSGRYHWVEFHLTLPASWDIDRGHQVASAIEMEIEEALGEGNATAHVEPCREANCASCASHVSHAVDPTPAGVGQG